MFKLLSLLALVATLSSCINKNYIPRAQTYENVILQLHGKQYKVKKVYLNFTDYIDVVYPVGDSLIVLPTQAVHTIMQDEASNKRVTTVELD